MRTTRPASAPTVRVVERRPEDARRLTAREVAETRALAQRAARDLAPLLDLPEVRAELATRDAAARWQDYRAKQADRAQAGVTAKREDAAQSERDFADRVRAWRKKHPDAKPRRLARLLLRLPEDRPLDAAENRRVNQLAAKVRRLLRR